MKHIKSFIVVLISILLVNGIVWAANTFPTTLNSWSYGDVITEDWANSLEAKIGVTNSAVTTSNDYMIRDRLTYAYASSTYQILGDYITDVYATSSFQLIGDYITDVYATSTFLQLSEATSTITGWVFASDYLTWANATNTYQPIGNYITDVYATSTFLTLTGGTLTDILSGTEMILTYGLTSVTTTMSGLITANGGFISNSSSTQIGDFSIEGNSTTTGDIYVGGDINTSNGEMVDYEVKCFPMSTSTREKATTTLLGSFPQAITVSSQWCRGDVNGTSTVYLTDLTDDMDLIDCGWTHVLDESLSNNTWNAYEPIYLKLQKVTAIYPTTASHCIKFYYTKD